MLRHVANSPKEFQGFPLTHGGSVQHGMQHEPGAPERWVLINGSHGRGLIPSPVTRAGSRMNDEIARLMKEAFQTISGSAASERENLTRGLAKRLQEESPETPAMIAGAKGDGIFLSKLSEIALKSALERPDFSADDQLEAFIVVRDFADVFGAVCEAPRGLCPLPLAFDLAFKAMFVGLNAGAPPEKIEEARVLGRKAVSRSGG
jgi:hypothetical protein